MRRPAPAPRPHPRDPDDREAASARALAHKAARYDKLAQGYGLADDGLVDWDAKDVESPASTPSPPTELADAEELVESDVILPPRDISFNEAKGEFTGEGLIPD